MIRFEDVSEDVLTLAEKVQEEHFPLLKDILIKYLFDLEKRTRNGSLVLGRCWKANDLVKFLTAKETIDMEGFPYIITLDKVAYENMEEKDRVRLLRHEQRHILIDYEAKQPYKIYPHNVEDFIEEIELNGDDPRWASRITEMIETIYEQEEETPVSRNRSK